MKLNKLSTWYLILLIPFIEPQLFKTHGFELVDKLFLCLKLIASAFIVLEYLVRFKFKITKYVILMSIVQAATFIGTYLNHGSLTRYLGPAMISVVMIMLGEMAFAGKWVLFLKYIEKYLTFLFILNLFTVVLRMVGVSFFSHATLLGIDNRWIYVLLPWIIISFLNSYIEFNKIKLSVWIKYILCIGSLLLKWSVGALVSIIIFPVVFGLIFYLKDKNIKIIRLINAKLIYILFLIINYILLSGKLLEILSVIIVKYLKKSITLSGRIYLWQTVIEVLNKKPLFGLGVQSNEFDEKFFYESSGFVGGTVVNHPHNHFLNVAYHGGFIALIVFILIVFITMCDIDKIKEKGIYCVMVAGTVSVMLAALVDTLDFSLFYLFIPIAAGLSKIYNGNMIIKVNNKNFYLFKKKG